MEDQEISHFRVLEKLGAGGMGEVYLAEDTRLGRRVALKRVTESPLRSPLARQRLRHEARIAAQLNHPHIAAIYDIIESGDQTHIVMEYVAGETLAAISRRGPLPLAEAVKIGIQVSEALVEAHGYGVVHRDLKPSNLVMTPEASVKVLDFGLAKRDAPPVATQPSEGSTTETSLTAPGEILGTPAYMAPEQILGKRADARSDIYSLGVVLYELITGRRPFHGSDALALGMAILTEPTPSIAVSNPDVPAALSGIVARAMARDPDARYSSAAQLREELEAFLTDGSAGSSPAGRTRSLWARVRRGKPAAITGAMVLTLLALLLYLTPWALRRPPVGSDRPPIVIVLPFSNLSGDPSKDYIGVGIAASLSNALARLPALGVVSAGVVDEYLRSKGRNPARIAKDLDATIVVDGAVQESNGRIQVSLNLVRPDGSIEWPYTEVAALSGVFTLQSRIAESVGLHLQSELTEDSRRLLAKPLTGNMEAFRDYARGQAYIGRPDMHGNVDLAIKSFESAIRRDPGFSAAHAGLGEACWQQYIQTKQPQWVEKAKEGIYEALRLDPDQALVRLSLAQLLKGTGRPDDALGELHRVIEKQPNNDEAHRLAGQILAGKAKYDAAYAEFKQAIKLRPDYWRNHYALGSAYYNAGRLREAAQSFERVTKLQPTNAWGFLNLGNTCLRLGDLPRALDNLQKSIAIEPDAYTYASIGTIHYWNREYEKAAEAYEAAISMLPNENWLHRNLGDARARLGEREQATAAYQEAVRLSLELLRVNDKDAGVLAKLAVYQAKLGRRDEALRRAAEAVRLLPSDPDVIYSKAVVHCLLGENDEAMALLKRAVEHGYSLFDAKMDDDLAELRSLPAFKVLMAGRE